MAQLMPLPLTVSCFSKIQIGFTFVVLAHPGSPGKRAIKWVCVCVLSHFDYALPPVHYVQTFTSSVKLEIQTVLATPPQKEQTMAICRQAW